MLPVADAAATRAVVAAAHPLVGTPQDFDPLLALVGNARVVLLGEASHGTHDFYRVRAEITKRLIRERGFRAVHTRAVEPLERTPVWERGQIELPETYPSAL